MQSPGNNNTRVRDAFTTAHHRQAPVVCCLMNSPPLEHLAAARKRSSEVCFCNSTRLHPNFATATSSWTQIWPNMLLLLLLLQAAF
jgi:hypothetical protein